MLNEPAHTLIETVSKIYSSYKYETNKTGENFNVFKILKLETNEVRTHSRFLAELLNVKGTHGQGPFFLETFLELLKANFKLFENFEFDFNNSDIQVEKPIDNGRIDLILTDKKNQIIIENKIYAGDQDRQLVKYNSRFPKAPILYLTLRGDLPSDASKGELKEGENFICISYETDIQKWLKKCLEYPDNEISPIVKQTIVQYSNLIDSLTIKNSIKKMKDKIKAEILTDSSKFESAKLVKECYNEILEERVEKFWELLGEGYEKIGKGLCRIIDIEYDDYVIKWFIKEETGVFYYALRASKKNNEGVVYNNDLKVFSKLIKIISDINIDMKNDSWNLGWVYSKEIGRASIYEFLQNKSSLITNEVELKRLVDDVKRETNYYIDNFTKAFNELNQIN